MDIHRLRVVGFANAENGNNKTIAEQEETGKEDDVIVDDKLDETNEVEASDEKCPEVNVVSSGSSKVTNFVTHKSKSEIFRISSPSKY